MRISRQRIRKAKPLRGVIGSYAVVMIILVGFLLALFLLVALELLFLGS